MCQGRFQAMKTQQDGGCVCKRAVEGPYALVGSRYGYRIDVSWKGDRQMGRAGEG